MVKKQIVAGSETGEWYLLKAKFICNSSNLLLCEVGQGRRSVALIGDSRSITRVLITMFFIFCLSTSAAHHDDKMCPSCLFVYSVSQKKIPPRGPDIFSFFSQTVENL